jgi:hypothetical protein
MRVPVEQLEAVVGHRFPGGRMRIEHWENYLLTEATGRGPMPDGLAHPAHMFHVPIAGVGVSIAELFALGKAESDASITIDYYDWEFFQPLREQQDYDFAGGIIEHERREVAGGTIVDSLTFQIDMSDEAESPVARASFRWHYWRLQA